jgi:hypothetical protein
VTLTSLFRLLVTVVLDVTEFVFVFVFSFVLELLLVVVVVTWALAVCRGNAIIRPLATTTAANTVAAI